jgi:hypothetical protein
MDAIIVHCEDEVPERPAGPALFGWCQNCHRLFMVKQLREDAGKQGPTRVYRCKRCDREETYETGRESPYCLY